MALTGGNPYLATAAMRLVHGVRGLGVTLPFRADDGDVFGRRLLPWKCPSLNPPPLAWCFLPGCKTLTCWLGDDGACGVVPFVGGVALEARAMPAMAAADKVET
jgi:hypothetical protein